MKRFFVFSMVIAIAVSLCACSFQFSTANYSDLKISTGIDEDYNPVGITNKISTTTPMVYVTGVVKNAPEGTTIKAVWYYVDDNHLIDSAEYQVNVSPASFYFSLSKPTNDWPTGEYKAELYIDNMYKTSLTFTVE